MSTRWISNLESMESMAKAVEDAAAALKASSTPAERRQASALLNIAKFKQADVARTLAQLRMEYNGRITIGSPMATEWRTSDEIAADGIVGIYREGAGTGA